MKTGDIVRWEEHPGKLFMVAQVPLTGYLYLRLLRKDGELNRAWGYNLTARADECTQVPGADDGNSN